jgi:hypothetical protein
MNRKEVEKIIKFEMGSFLRQYGYTYNSTAQAFISRSKNGFKEVSCSIVDYGEKFPISFSFLIRVNRVEEVAQNIIFVVEKYKDIAYTINTGMLYFTGVREYVVETQTELYRLVNNIKDLYSSRVDEFLGHFLNIGNLDIALNKEKASINKMIEPDNGIRSLIIAKLNSNPDFDKLAEEYYQWYLREYYLDVEDGPRKIKNAITYLKKL